MTTPAEAQSWFKEVMIPKIRKRIEAAGFTVSAVVDDYADGAPMLVIEAERTNDAKFNSDLAVGVTWTNGEIFRLCIAVSSETQMDACADAQVRQFTSRDAHGAIDWKTRSQNSRSLIGLHPLELPV